MARSLWKKGLSLVLSLSLALLFLPRIARASGYNDIAASPAREAIQRWSAYGVMHGDGSGAFHPDSPLTRAEAAQFVVNLLHLEKTADLSGYTDVDEHAWYAVGLSKCVKAGLIRGSGTKLMPTELANRETVMVILCLALGIDETLSPVDVTVADDSAISGWARGYVHTLLNLGFNITQAGELHPKAPMTRGEFAELLDRLIAVYVYQDGTRANVARKGITLTVADNVVLSGPTTYPVVVAGSTEPKVDLSRTRGSYPLVVRANNAIVTGAPARCHLNTVWAPNCTVNGTIYATYTLQFVDQDGFPVEGVKASLWEDTLCHSPKTADSTGRILFPMTPYNYHSEILSVPDGYINEGPTESYLSNGGGTYVFHLTKLPSPEEEKDSAGDLPAADTAPPEVPETTPEPGRIRIDVPEGYQVGDRMPDFTFRDYFGNTHSLYETLATKDMVLVNLWNSEDYWSLSAMPLLENAYGQYQDSAEIFALSEQDSAAAIQAFALANGCSFPMGTDPVGLRDTAGLGSGSLSFVVDRYGIITQIKQGPFLSQSEIDAVFETYTAEDYPVSVLFPDEIGTLCTIAPSTTEELSSALNTPGGTLLFYNPEDSTSWPFLATDAGDRSIAVASNPGIANSRAVLGFQVSVQAGDCLALEYLLDWQQDLECLLLYVDGVETESFRGTADWTTYVYPLPPGTHTITLAYLCGTLSETAGPGTAWLDNISIVPEEEAVRLLTQQARWTD